MPTPQNFRASEHSAPNF